MLLELLPTALECGITIEKFWDYTLAEINLIITAYNSASQRRFKEQAILNHNLANLIGYSVGRLMDEKAKMPSLYEMYPALFEEERALEEELQAEQQWLLAKERLLKYAESHNRKRGEIK